MKLASIFTDHMVLQAGKPVKIFGEGKGEIKISFLGKQFDQNSNGDEWCVTLPEYSYGGPYEMNINLNGEEIILKDIYVGEVWIAGGQSNMEMVLLRTEYGIEESENAFNDKIRFFTVPRRYEKNTISYNWNSVKTYGEDTPWKICDKESSLCFSAIGYYTAKMLQQQLGVAVGIISCNWGGTPIETYIKREYFENCVALRPKLEEYQKMLSELEPDDYKIRFNKSLEEWEEYYNLIGNEYEIIKEKGVRACTGEPTDKPFPQIASGPFNQSMPGALYDSMFLRIIPYGVKGFLWYQGEANGSDKDYLEKYLVFMKCMRDSFQNSDMPFYAVELASFSSFIDGVYQNSDDRFVTENNWAFLREQQQKATVVDVNNYLVTSMELGDLYDIHPIQKKELSKRLVNKILKHTYDFDLYADHPVFKEAKFKDGKVYISFYNADGLYCKWLDGVKMYVADESHMLKRANVEIKDDMIILSCIEVEKPILARYGFDFYYSGCHIYNKAGLPIAPFRTDK